MNGSRDSKQGWWENGELYVGRGTFVANSSTTQDVGEVVINFEKTITENGTAQEAINSILQKLVEAVGKALDWTASAVNVVLEKGNQIDVPGLTDLWKFSRNFVLSIMLGVIILIAFANVISTSQSSTVSTSLPRLFVSMMLVFISYHTSNSLSLLLV